MLALRNVRSHSLIKRLQQTRHCLGKSKQQMMRRSTKGTLTLQLFPQNFVDLLHTALKPTLLPVKLLYFTALKFLSIRWSKPQPRKSGTKLTYEDAVIISNNSTNYQISSTFTSFHHSVSRAQTHDNHTHTRHAPHSITHTQTTYLPPSPKTQQNITRRHQQTSEKSDPTRPLETFYTPPFLKLPKHFQPPPLPVHINMQ